MAEGDLKSNPHSTKGEQNLFHEIVTNFQLLMSPLQIKLVIHFYKYLMRLKSQEE